MFYCILFGHNTICYGFERDKRNKRRQLQVCFFKFSYDFHILYKRLARSSEVPYFLKAKHLGLFEDLMRIGTLIWEDVQEVNRRC